MVALTRVSRKDFRPLFPGPRREAEQCGLPAPPAGHCVPGDAGQAGPQTVFQHHMATGVVLYCTVSVLYCSVLYCSVLYCTVV